MRYVGVYSPPDGLDISILYNRGIVSVSYYPWKQDDHAQQMETDIINYKQSALWIKPTTVHLQTRMIASSLSERYSIPPSSSLCSSVKSIN